MDQLIDAKLREILLGCEGVTPGPWYTTGAPWFRSEDGVMAGSPDGNIGYLIADCEDGFNARDEYTGPFPLGDKDADAAHIARLDPDTVKELCRLALIGLEAERSPVPKGDGLRPTHRHVKRGSEYVLIGYGKMQAEKRYRRHGMENAVDVDMAEVAIYRSVDDGSLWVRPRDEFEDGRFVALASPAPVKADAEVVAPVDTIVEEQCHYCGDMSWNPHRCRSGGGHDWRPTGRNLSIYPEGPLYATPSSGGRREALEEAAFDKWWAEDGQYIDPDTSDVPWFDKRRGLAEAAFNAGRKS